MYTRAVKGEPFLDTKYRGRPPSAMAKTKHSHSDFPHCKSFLKQKTHENYFLLHVYNYTTYTPESKIRMRHEKRDRKKKREKVRGREGGKEKRKRERVGKI